jgi:diadenosine tetraphosphate (Ap4A) HIT family hydrolase
MSAMNEQSFALAPQIEAASKLVLELPLSQVRLMNDARFPWLLLVPQRPALEEWTDLNSADLVQLSVEIHQAAQLMTRLWAPDKVNIASLGNLVRQLHIHVVGRKFGDAAWPGPVWGFASPMPYSEQVMEELCGQLRKLMTDLPHWPEGAPVKK